MEKPHKKLVTRLFMIVLLMFGFTFTLIPLYNVFCDVTGLNGKVDITKPGTLSRYKNDSMINRDRLIVVELDTNRHQGIPIEFTAEKSALEVIPGELTLTTYHIKNLTNKKIVIQAIPSISPGYLAKHLKKLECFCFEQQT